MTIPAASGEASSHPLSTAPVAFPALPGGGIPRVRSARDFEAYVAWLQQKSALPATVAPRSPHPPSDARPLLASPELAEFRAAGGILRFDQHFFQATGHLSAGSGPLAAEPAGASPHANLAVPPVSPEADPPPAARIAHWEVPDFQWPEEIEATLYRQPQLADQVRHECTQFLRPRARRAVLVGHQRRQGTTWVATALARWAAHHGQRVLLVDADLAHPGLASSLGIEVGGDISWEFAADRDEPLADAMIQSARTGVCFVPLAHRQPVRRGSAARLDTLGELLRPVQDAFDLVLIDAGSANQLMNSLTRPVRLVDTALLVHNGGQTGEPRPGSTLARLKAFGVASLISVENRATREN